MRKNLKRLQSNINGSSAVEFAIVFPVFILATLTMIGYGIYISAAASVQQITADAARAAIAGLSIVERQSLAIDFVTAAMSDRPFIDPVRVTTTVRESASLAGSLNLECQSQPKSAAFCDHVRETLRFPPPSPLHCSSPRLQWQSITAPCPCRSGRCRPSPILRQ